MTSLYDVYRTQKMLKSIQKEVSKHKVFSKRKDLEWYASILRSIIIEGEEPDSAQQAHRDFKSDDVVKVEDRYI
jgi:hypothetical protein